MIIQYVTFRNITLGRCELKFFYEALRKNKSGWSFILCKSYTSWEVSKYGVFPGLYSVCIQENTDQKKLKTDPWKINNMKYVKICIHENKST